VFPSDELTAPPQEALAPPQAGGVDVFANADDVKEIARVCREQLKEARDGKSERAKLVDRLDHIYEMRDPERDPAFPGGANYQAPLIRSKIDGEVAYQVDALDQDPFYVFRARSADAEAARVNLEEYIDQRLDELDFRSIAFQVTREAYKSGTGIAKVGWEVSDLDGGRLTVDVIPFRDHFVNPHNVDSLDRAYFIGDRFHRAYHELRDLHERGLIQDPSPCVRNPGKGPQEHAHEAQGSGRAASSEKDAEYIELHECWVRWRPWQYDDQQNGVTRSGNMWQVWWHDASETVLLARPNPHWHGRAPYALVEQDPRLLQVYGAPYGEKLLPYQQELNVIINQRTDINSYAAAPVFFEQLNSLEAKWLAQNALQPGARIPTNSPQNPALTQLQLAGANPVTLQDQQLLYQMADKISIPDTSLAQPLVNRDPTATEVSRDMGVVAAQTKARLHHLHVGFRQLGYLVLHTLFQHEIAPAGAEGISFLTGEDEKRVTLLEVFLDSLELSVNGRETATAKVERQQAAVAKMQMLMPLITPNPQTGQKAISDPAIWELAKELCDALGAKNWKQLLGPKPDPREDMMLQLLAQQMMAGGAGAQESAGQPAPPAEAPPF
jgi:hypothetical protein